MSLHRGLLDLDIDRLAHCAQRVARTEASVEYWLRRSAEFEAARPRASDFTGQATTSDLAERDARCATAATACRHRAALAWEHTATDNTIREVA